MILCELTVSPMTANPMLSVDGICKLISSSTILFSNSVQFLLKWCVIEALMESWQHDGAVKVYCHVEKTSRNAPITLITLLMFCVMKLPTQTTNYNIKYRFSYFLQKEEYQ